MVCEIVRTCADSTPNLTALWAAVDGSRAPKVFDVSRINQYIQYKIIIF
jgi:hypothetical protein